jgi:hypothetical protein
MQTSRLCPRPAHEPSHAAVVRVPTRARRRTHPARRSRHHARLADNASADGAQLLVLAVTARDLETSSMSQEIGEYARVEHLAGGEAEGRRVLADILAGAKRIVGGRKELKAICISRAGDSAEEISHASASGRLMCSFWLALLRPTRRAFPWRRCTEDAGPQPATRW